MTASGKEEITQAEAAKRLGITAQALGVWAKRPGAPVVLRNGKPRCVWPDFPKWRDAERDRQARAEAAPDTPTDMAEATLRLESARAEKAELEVRRLRGELVTVDEAASAMEAKLAPLRSALVTLPQRMAPLVMECRTVAEVTAKLDGAVAEAMASIAEGA